MTLHFRSIEAYRKWNAYRFKHVEKILPHHHVTERVYIAGRLHHVKHCSICGKEM